MQMQRNNLHTFTTTREQEMDVQQFLNAMSDDHARMRSNYHLTLGSMIAILEGIPATTMVFFDTGDSPVSVNSYRGYYSDLALSKGTGETIEAAALLEILRAAVGETFEGYKGGEYVMAASTPLWEAHYGDCGRAIMGGKMEGQNLILMTKELS